MVCVVSSRVSDSQCKEVLLHRFSSRKAVLGHTDIFIISCNISVKSVNCQLFPHKYGFSASKKLLSMIELSIRSLASNKNAFVVWKSCYVLSYYVFRYRIIVLCIIILLSGRKWQLRSRRNVWYPLSYCCLQLLFQAWYL